MGEILPVVVSTSDDSQCNRSAAVAWSTKQEQGESIPMLQPAMKQRL